MQIFGFTLKRPAYRETTATAVLAVGLWLTLAGLAARTDPDITRVDLACLLAVIWMVLMGRHIGVDPGRSWRALSFHVATCAAAVGALRLLLA